MHTIIADVPSPGLYVGYFFAAFTALAALAAGASFVYAVRRDSGEAEWVALGSAITMAVVGGITLAAMWPLKYEYHHYVTKGGTVESVNKRLVGIGSENGASERYVMKFVGDNFPYGVDDTRAALVKPGQHVGIKCKKEHQWFQPYDQDGWACRWGG